MGRSFFLIICLIYFLPFIGIGQGTSPLQKDVTVSSSVVSLESILDLIQQETGVTISYNLYDPSLNSVVVEKGRYTISSLLQSSLTKYEYRLSESSTDRITLNITKRKSFNIYGYLKDSENGTVVSGGIIQVVPDGSYAVSDKDGYFSLSTEQDSVTINIRNLGYKDTTIMLVMSSDRFVKIDMKFDNVYPTILITKPNTDSSPIVPIVVNATDVNSNGSVVGIKDVLNRIKLIPSVQSSREGDGSLYVRGGSPDQNLILYDGMPIYEISHTAGISNIFITESIQDVNLFATDIPARYSGRLSSVVEVNLKDGNKNKTESSFSMGNYGPALNVSGPLIKDKISYNISGRTSWINLYLDNLLTDVIDFDNVDLGFNDFNGKITYDISPVQTLSLSAYYGSDNLKLEKRTTSQRNALTFDLEEGNEISWTSKLLALNYHNVISDKVKLSATAGYVDYNYLNRGSYRFFQFSSVNPIVDELDVVAKSKINDYKISSSITYYRNNKHIIKTGLSFLTHSFNPALRQSKIILEGGVVQQIGDNTSEIGSNDYNFFLENQLRLNSDIQLTVGANFSHTRVQGVNYSYIEPRVALHAQLPYGINTNLSYNRLSQFLHLLVNPGLGLPSNLWVPSTERISPEVGQQWNFSASKSIGGNLDLTASVYYRETDGLLDYRLGDGIYSTILNGSGFTPVFNNDKEWENQVVQGSGVSKGIELQAEYTLDPIHLWFSYTRSSAIRQFEEIDNNTPFPYKYDRPHDIKVSIDYSISAKHKVGSQWVYGSGSNFTLALESYEGIDGIDVVRPSARNNFRLPAHHHLDIYYTYKSIRKNGTPISFNAGVYNVYNQLNPYYAFLVDDKALNETSLR